MGGDSARSVSVLLLEDDEEEADRIAALLRQAGHEVRAAPVRDLSCLDAVLDSADVVFF